MDPIDLKIRRQWLAVWMGSLGIGLLNAWLQMRYQLNLGIPSIVAYATAGCGAASLVLYAWISHTCIYKKPGTKLLSFLIVLTAVSLVASPVLYWTGIWPAPPHIPYYAAYLAGSQVLGALWLIACWRMRKTNKKLRAQMSQLPNSLRQKNR